MKNPYINGGYFSRLDARALRLSRGMEGFFGGRHRTKRYGQTVEFADFREYMLGDDIRRIDWNLYSRFKKYFIKLYQDERQMAVNIYLDCSASMGRDIHKKGQYAAAIAAGLGYLAVRGTDKLYLRYMCGEAFRDPFGLIVGKSAFFRAASAMDDIKFDGECDISAAVISDKKCGKNDGLSVIISDFLTDNDWKRAVDFLRYNGRQVLLVQLLAEEEVSPSYTGRMELIDSESLAPEDARNLRLKIGGGQIKAYEEALEGIRQRIRSFASSRGAGYAFVDTGTPPERAIFTRLAGVGMLE